ncbi:group 1 truncated hemoglobin [Colwellia sp. MB02u-10]|uniref:group I truncated hemoglobin n=1 Tax=Colwellia sp. MB02u-10 TaxID=2759828 RepID=UPI0015F52C4A|nr:group 1 truncated hemoglobin [Colwellia sp. MB02u-10]MBA6341652.1 group 1 truncated hemoglobin [Colwellia sp. MB02u-10]
MTKSIILLLLMSCLACSSPSGNIDSHIDSHIDSNSQAQTELTLYEEMGEKPALDNIIDNLINIIGQDDVVFSHFAQSNVTRFKDQLTVFLCHLADGPCQYKGDSMKDIHQGMYINKNEFNHFVELFIEAMDNADISYPIQNKLLARLAPLRKTIIKI